MAAKLSEAGASSVLFDRALIARLDGKGPRYTSYPTADRFTSAFSVEDYQTCLNQRQMKANHEPVSLYVHIPFCNTVCYYCGCNKVITKDTQKAERYLAYLVQELDLYREYFAERPPLAQLHLGGGTPTFLTDDQLSRLCAAIKTRFDWQLMGEFSIEIDPRKVAAERIQHLAALGFNRLSVGVQDFDIKVQTAVNREQSEAETYEVITAARASGFQSVSIDLIYGLPHQSVASVQATLARALEMRPDRLAFYNYAHLPAMFMPQRRIQATDLPSAAEKLDILHRAVETLCDAGYVFIGMDHFALPHDDLAVALREGRLQRNFQGYSTHAEHDLIGIGVSSIGKIGRCYAQNEKELDAYYAALDARRLPILRGLVADDDDVLRREVIQRLMCQFELSIEAVESKYSIDFYEYFCFELERLREYAADGLIDVSHNTLTVTPRGRFLIRTLAMVFDRHLRESRTASVQYSKTI